MRVRITTTVSGHKPGTVVDLPEDQAKKLVKDGKAKKLDDEKGQVSLRFRRTVTIKDKSFQAGTKELVDQSDEIWEAVSRGDADCDPLPGEPIADGFQPFPPEWVGRDETSDAPDPTVTATPAATAKVTPHPAPAAGGHKGS